MIHKPKDIFNLTTSAAGGNWRTAITVMRGLSGCVIEFPADREVIEEIERRCQAAEAAGVEIAPMVHSWNQAAREGEES